jgi:hypothetical protein
VLLHHQFDFFGSAGLLAVLSRAELSSSFLDRVLRCPFILCDAEVDCHWCSTRPLTYAYVTLSLNFHHTKNHANSCRHGDFIASNQCCRAEAYVQSQPQGAKQLLLVLGPWGKPEGL